VESGANFGTKFSSGLVPVIPRHRKAVVLVRAGFRHLPPLHPGVSASAIQTLPCESKVRPSASGS
jgi:hypothetical protein